MPKIIDVEPEELIRESRSFRARDNLGMIIDTGNEIKNNINEISQNVLRLEESFGVKPIRNGFGVNCTQ